MPRAYWVNLYREITDTDKLAAYVELGAPAVRAAGGRFLSRGAAAAAFESGQVERSTLIEFPDLDTAVAAYSTDAYQQALAALGDGADRDVRVVEGLAGSDIDDRAGAVDAYFDDRLVPADPEGDAVRRGTADGGLPDIAVSPLQGKFLYTLARLAGARRVLEVGTLGGYSTLWFARAVDAEGRVVTLEYDAHHADVARANLDAAGVGDRVEIVVGAARDTIAAQTGPFDAVFVDADKGNNAAYVEAALELSRPGTVIVVDNVVRDGAVADPDDRSEGARGSREVVDLVGRHPRLDGTALQTVGARGHDGFLVALVTG